MPINNCAARSLNGMDGGAKAAEQDNTFRSTTSCSAVTQAMTPKKT
jgi:hypothetical protein